MQTFVFMVGHKYPAVDNASRIGNEVAVPREQRDGEVLFAVRGGREFEDGARQIGIADCRARRHGRLISA